MTMQSTEPSPISTEPVQPNSRYFTEADLERAREQEKSKLYDRLERQQQQLDVFKSTVDDLKAEKDARLAETSAQRKAAEDAQRRAEEEKMSAQQLINAREAEFNKKLEEQRLEMDNKVALWQKEQRFLQLGAYATRRVAEEISEANVLPELAEYITGESEQDIEAAIAIAREKTDRIVKGAQTLTAPVPPGVSPTGAPGIMSLPQGPRELTPAEIAQMSMEQYKQYRLSRGMDRRGNGQGMFS